MSSVVRWFAQHARDLPWRSTSPWGVLVSEVMLQQTPVVRVLPRWHEWLDRWPTAPDLARATQADAVRAWGRLGYPRRAQRLHAAAGQITTLHGGEVPREEEELRALPGVGEYTAAAVRAFAFGIPSVVLDVNVRRVLARAYLGRAFASAHITRAERELARDLQGNVAAWSAAMMELGALVCTARSPACETCPLASQCEWKRLGYPWNAPAPRTQPKYAGSDRQMRGAILAILRENVDGVSESQLARGHDPAQYQRALESLISDGLIVRMKSRYVLAP